MPFILTIVYLLQGFIDANAAPPLDLLSQRTNIDAQQCVSLNARSKWDIVWSCLVTIFACSWASVHPNILAPDEGRWKKALQRFELVFWSIISPELVIYWASVQWYGAHCLGKKYSEYGWTTTHGHFIQMGGFILYDGDKEAGVLVPGKLWDLLQEEKVAMPKVTEREIKDRSKSDKLSKAAVVIQTTWFITQCIARRVRGLIITELELVTLAFAALNAIMYAFWWDKPLDVTTTVRVHLLHPTAASTSLSVETNERLCDANSALDSLNLGESSILEDSNIERREKNQPLKMKTHKYPARKLRHSAHQAVRGMFSNLLHRAFAWIISIVRTTEDMADFDKAQVNTEDKIRLNTFYAHDPNPEELTLAKVILTILHPLCGIIFGVIHCAGWNFAFPSVIELNIWRFSSGIITAAAAIGVMDVLFSFLERYYTSTLLVSRFRDVLRWMTLPMVPLYILARFSLLVEALISLRELPQSALAVVTWTSFIPHV